MISVLSIFLSIIAIFLSLISFIYKKNRDEKNAKGQYYLLVIEKLSEALTIARKKTDIKLNIDNSEENLIQKVSFYNFLSFKEHFKNTIKASDFVKPYFSDNDNDYCDIETKIKTLDKLMKKFFKYQNQKIEYQQFGLNESKIEDFDKVNREINKFKNINEEFIAFLIKAQKEYVTKFRMLYDLDNNGQ